MEKINATISDVGSKWNPWAQKLSRGFSQVKQYAQEKMGNIEDITKLPQEYLDLEERVDKIRELHEFLLKVTKHYTRSTHDYDQSLGESFYDTATKVSEKISSKPESTPKSPTTPMSQGHAISKVCLDTANSILASKDENDPFGVALKKISNSYENIGEAKVAEDNAIVENFWKPFNTTLNSSIAFAMKARRNVYSARLNYDACKQNLKNAKIENVDVGEFVRAVEEAMSKMKIVIESSEPLKNLNSFIEAQLEYHKRVYEILSELSPEINELELNNEAILREKALSNQ
ncbi:hypothetical protein H8356DRAFT_922804 [Neocallimastix lanati (nom. inval.)]|uniref:BAR domain-containing protein n=1 Tax=Neocallimastix californiae TaxID=1754190 RepID=A0A1Y2BFT8_9FUNG|nr:hypothetical protein H8356DRAFT_922804 [Neocallimastix sp. JGI-2020a]ORY33673.1 hypothetical protein LY90DRAFT_512031 [Neocallimastix californiae]|eukprot:ORY33673.1 hypothetical protein LY90DRAFT_512031 [Neocallimastix californiae]